MVINVRIARLLVVCSLGVWAPVVFAQDTAGVDTTDCRAEEALVQLEERYNRRGPITFTFHKETVSAVFGDESKQEGRVWFDPAGRFRVEAENETFILNGDTLWHWVPAYSQVTVRILDSGSRAGLPLDFLWALRRDFLPVDCRKDTLNGQVFLKVRTVAKTATAAIQRLTVWINLPQFLVEQAEYIDYNDDRVRLRFSSVKKDTDSGNVRYLPQFPDSAEVIIFPQKKRQQNPTGQR